MVKIIFKYLMFFILEVLVLWLIFYILGVNPFKYYTMDAELIEANNDYAAGKAILYVGPVFLFVINIFLATRAIKNRPADLREYR